MVLLLNGTDRGRFSVDFARLLQFLYYFVNYNVKIIFQIEEIPEFSLSMSLPIHTR